MTLVQSFALCLPSLITAGIPDSMSPRPIQATRQVPETLPKVFFERKVEISCLFPWVAHK